MSTFTKVNLSASTNGRMIPLMATSTLGSAIHTGDATALDEVWLWANNNDVTARPITIEWGGVASGDMIRQTIPAQAGKTLIVAGELISNSLVISAFCSGLEGVVNIGGYVNRISD